MSAQTSERTGVPQPRSKLHGQVVLITGAASGIGAATALEVRARGGVPVLLDCDAEPLAQVAHQCGADTLALVADVTDLPAMEAAVAQVLARFGHIDMVFANAGVAAFGPLAYVDPVAWKRCVEVNLFGVFNTVRAALPSIMRQRGYVLINASVSSFAHPPVMSAYAASKSAVEAMGNSWRIELAAHKVGVGLVHAGWVSIATSRSACDCSRYGAPSESNLGTGLVASFVCPARTPSFAICRTRIATGCA
ncbi:MAG: SDR family NAD(P)-dependent oxidoreductase [Betaproteobacteria bacterium]|nr:SDR family NAD(P)-dependent oxidoreductase [Betaproteobacteria bacterium]